MLSYEVTIQLDDLPLADSLAKYMRDIHVGEVFATGCFLDAHFEQSAPDVYRSRYTAASAENLDRYLADHAPRLRADFMQHFPGGMRITRTIWNEVAGF